MGRSQLHSHFKKRMCYHLFITLNRAIDVLRGDWQSQMHAKNYCNFSQVELKVDKIRSML